jgi:putative membrane protein
MKLVIVALLLLAAPSAFAQSISEKTGLNAMLDKPPTSADVLSGLHQFDLFQQEVADSADKRGDDILRKFARALSDAAEKRGKLLAALNTKNGLEVKFPEEPGATRNNRLGGLEGSVADVYVQGFYKAEVTEHDAAISLLKRYLEKPDNDEVRGFAEKQLPILQSGLRQAQQAAPK